MQPACACIELLRKEDKDGKLIPLPGTTGPWALQSTFKSRWGGGCISWCGERVFFGGGGREAHHLATSSLRSRQTGPGRVSGRESPIQLGREGQI